MRSKTRRRGVRFLFFVFFFLTAKVVLIKVSLYVKGCLERGAFNLTCNNKPELFEKDDGLIM